MVVNVKLLKKVRKLIAEEPRRLDMNKWGYKVESLIIKPRNPPPCGTVACLAGWTVLAAKPKKQWNAMFDGGGALKGYVAYEAAELLGIDEHECPFHEWHWSVREVLAWIDRQIDAAK